MIYTKVIYPPSVEEKLVVLCDCVKSIEIDKKIQKVHEHCLRHVYGPVLFDRWLKGEEKIMSEDEMMSLLTQAAAHSIVCDLEDAGTIDTIEDEQGDAIAFFPKS